MSSLNKTEQSAIKALKKAFDGLPQSLRVYVVDDAATVCKIGVSSSEVCASVGRNLRPGCVLEDIHDEMNNGRW